MLLALRDGEENTWHVVGPDQNGTPRVLEIIVYRENNERHSRMPTRKELARPPRFQIVEQDGFYHVENV